jgi:hypothetical protein
MDNRLRQCDRGHGCFLHTHDDSVAAGRGFGFYPLLSTLREDQHTALSTRVLNRGPHERIDQVLQDDLA